MIANHHDLSFITERKYSDGIMLIKLFSVFCERNGCLAHRPANLAVMSSSAIFKQS